MGFFFGLLNLLIIGSIFYSIVLSLRESAKASERKKRRKKGPLNTQQEYMMGRADVEKKWVSRSNRNEKVRLRNAKKQQTVPSERQEENSKRWDPIQERTTLARPNREKAPTPKRQQTKPQNKNRATVLNKQTLAQAMLSKEILDKPLSLRKRR